MILRTFENANYEGTRIEYKSNDLNLNLWVYKFDEHENSNGTIMSHMYFGRKVSDDRLIHKIKAKVKKYVCLNLPIIICINVVSNDSPMHKILTSLNRNISFFEIVEKHKEYLLSISESLSNLNSNLMGTLITKISQYNMLDNYGIYFSNFELQETLIFDNVEFSDGNISFINFNLQINDND